MFIGHYGVALAAKTRAPAVSLGWFFLAVQALDVLFASFVLLGVEHMRIVQGFTAYNPYDLYDIAISHSLLGSAGWSLAAAVLARAMRVPWSGACALGFAVFSHFVLDVPMHTPDLPLVGASSPKLGLGLWNHRYVALALELVAFGIGLALYARNRVLRGRFWLFATALVVLTLATPFLPAPRTANEFALQALAAYAGLAYWAAWVDRSTPTKALPRA